MKRLYQCCLMALVLALLACCAAAEENLYDRLIPLMDNAAGEAMDADGRYIGVRPMGAELSPDGDAVVVLGDLYRADAQLDKLTPEQYGEVEWLDQRVVVQLQKDDSRSGWKVISFRVDAELLMENAAQAYFEETMRSYYSQQLGFYVQYPALFDEMQENDLGMQAVTKDGQAAFLAERTANREKLSLNALVERMQQQHKEAKVTINEASGVARLTYTEEGVTTADVYAASDAWIYHVQLRWTDDLTADFVVYSEYVMNSLSVDELGIG